MNYGDLITKLQVAPVELDVSSQSSCALRLARHSQMHGLDTSNVSSRVESSQVEFEPIESLECRKGTQKTRSLKKNNNKTNWWAIKAKVW